MSRPSKYLLPFIPFRVPMTVGFHTSPRHIPVTAHSPNPSHRLHSHPNVASQRLSLTHALSHLRDHLPKERLTGPLVRSTSCPSDCLHLDPSIDHPHTPCCFLATTRPERAADAPSSTPAPTLCPSNDQLPPRHLPSYIPLRTPIMVLQQAPISHFRPSAPSSIPHPFPLNNHPQRASDVRHLCPCNRLYLHTTLHTDNRRPPYPSHIPSQ